MSEMTPWSSDVSLIPLVLQDSDIKDYTLTFKTHSKCVN